MAWRKVRSSRYSNEATLTPGFCRIRKIAQFTGGNIARAAKKARKPMEMVCPGGN